MKDELKEVSITVKRPKKGHWQTSKEGGWEWVEDRPDNPPAIPNDNDPRKTAQPGKSFA